MMNRRSCSWCGRVVSALEDVVITTTDVVSGVRDSFHADCWIAQRPVTGLAG